MKKPMLLMAGLVMAGVAQARHPDLTRRATPGDRTFDLVVSYWGEPDGDYDGNTQDPRNPSTQDKIENIIGYMADVVYETAEGTH